MQHRLSFFRNAFDRTPAAVGLTWDRLVEVLSTHEFVDPDDVECPSCSGSGCRTCKDAGTVPRKLACEAFSPAYYPEHAGRGNANVEALSLFVADLDDLTEADLEAFVEAAIDRGWACHVFSTYSAGIKPGIRARALLPLSREVSPEEWGHVWHALNDALGGFSDPKCKDPARIYFGAYAPVGFEHEAFAETFPGSPVDVGELLDGWEPPPPPEPTADRTENPQLERVSRDRLERFARALTRKRDERKAEVGALLLQVVRGEPFAESGARDNTIFRMAQELGARFPECDPVSIARHFATSLSIMSAEAPECPTVDDVAYKVERAQHAILAERAQAQADEMASQRQRIRDAFRSDRETPYRPDEIPKRPRWLLQKGNAYYTWVAGTYEGPYTKEEAQNAIIRDLSPAVSAGVELFTVGPTGVVVPKSLGKLVRDYGLVVNDVTVDLSASEARLDEETRTIIEAPTPLREIEPNHDPEIAAWLEALAGEERAPLLLAWIANVTNLAKPCTALFMTGAKHTGKSLLPEGLSRLWTTLGMPTPLEDVLGTNFNDAQLRCPLTFADERLPTDHRGRVLNAELRHFIQARRRPLRRKFLPNADMIGATRLVISANNEEVLATSENLSNHDIEAIVDRYLWIPAQPEAAAVLKRSNTDGWVDGDRIAAHALWLRDNYQWKANGRFIVHSDDTELHSRLVSGSGIRSSVLQFCVGYLLDPKRLDVDARARLLIRVNEGRLCVNTQALVACWDTYVKNEKCPSTGRIAGAVSALAEPGRVRLALPNGKRPNYRMIRLEHLHAWAARTGYATEEQIDEALKVDTEERASHLQLVKESKP